MMYSTVKCSARNTAIGLCFSTRPLQQNPLPQRNRTSKWRAQAADIDPGAAFLEVATTIKSTGVPFLEELLQLSVSDAVSQSLVMMGRTALFVSLGTFALGAVHARLASIERQQITFHPIRSPLVALARPTMVLLPFYGFARIATVMSALAQVLALKMRPEFDAFTRGHAEITLSSIKWITQLLQDTSELVIIALCAWTIKRCKDRVVAALQLRLQQEEKGGREASGIVSMFLNSASGALNWGIWTMALFVTLQSYGINARPLFASLGASSIVVGIAAQKILANIMAGLSLYASSAFNVGDKIKLISSGGGVVVEGVVTLVAPARTVIRADDGALLYINNSDVASMIINNESQAKMASVH